MRIDKNYGKSSPKVVAKEPHPNDLLKYEVVSRGFQKKYEMDFETFRTSDLMKEPPHEVEQDYFDWELAITRMDEVKSELDKLAAMNG